MPCYRGASFWKRSPPGESLSGLEEGEQVGIDGVGVYLAHAVGEAGIDLEFGVLQDLCRLQTGSDDGNDLVIFAVEDEYGDVDFLEVFGAVGLGESLDGVRLALVWAQHAR